MVAGKSQSRRRACVKEGSFLERIGLPHSILRNEPCVYHTTGLSRDEITELCGLIYSAERRPGCKTWPPSLGLFKSVAITLTYLRRNRVQEELAETYATSQPTVSRAISAITPLIREVLTPFVPSADDLDEHCQYLVDGTLLPCWSWASHPELYSGKHKTTGMNVQVACTLDEKLAWISDPVEGSRHDNHCLKESGVLVAFNPANWIGDKGYVGNRMLTPVRKPQGRDLVKWEREFNKQVNKIRSMIERVIANFKTWRIMHTDYRRPIGTFASVISAVIGLHFWRARE